VKHEVDSGGVSELLPVHELIKLRAASVRRLEEVAGGDERLLKKELDAAQDDPHLKHKPHRYFLLEEMKWMAKDFWEERKWKIAHSKKLVKGVSNYHNTKESRQLRAV
jgi:hypothetical protein